MAETATTSRTRGRTQTAFGTTLLDLVWQLSSSIDDDSVAAAVAADLINSGQAKLTGNFKGTSHIAL